jgi:hypothetical protein
MTSPSNSESKPNPVRQILHESDVVIAPGLSVHFYGKTVGIYSARLKVGKGFTELPAADLLAIVKFFNLGPAVAKLSEMSNSNLGEG